MSLFEHFAWSRPGRHGRGGLWMRAVVLTAITLCASSAMAQSVKPSADAWQYSITPYLWLPAVDGNLRFGPPAAGGATPNVSVDAETMLGALDFAFMFSADARKGKWSIATDLIYLDLSSDKSGVNSIDFNAGNGPVNIANTALDAGTDVKLKGTVWTLAGGYSLLHEPRKSLDVIAGFRYFDLEATTSWLLTATVTDPVGGGTFSRVGSSTKSDQIWDAIIGVRGQFKVGDGKWFVPYYLDVGGGDSKLTWQGVMGVGYSYKWGDLGLVYRYLSYEQGGNNLIEKLAFGGLALGASFRF
jgi:hypothetical protein